MKGTFHVYFLTESPLWELDIDQPLHKEPPSTKSEIISKPPTASKETPSATMRYFDDFRDSLIEVCKK